ncbi:MAG: hypothetical protein ABW073_07755 [Acidimicrobiia bacterium]
MDPLTLDEVVSVFAPASFRWWITGGQALDLHLGRTWRSIGAHGNSSDVWPGYNVP